MGPLVTAGLVGGAAYLLIKGGALKPSTPGPLASPENGGDVPGANTPVSGVVKVSDPTKPLNVQGATGAAPEGAGVKPAPVLSGATSTKSTAATAPASATTCSTCPSTPVSGGPSLFEVRRTLSTAVLSSTSRVVY